MATKTAVIRWHEDEGYSVTFSDAPGATYYTDCGQDAWDTAHAESARLGYVVQVRSSAARRADMARKGLV